MNLILILARFCGELGLWLGMGGMVLDIFTEVSDLTAALPILCAAALLSDLFGRKRESLRWLGLLALAGLVPLVHSVGDGLLLAPAALYVASAVRSCTLVPGQEAVYYRFGAFVGMTVIAALLCVVLGSAWCFRCCILALVVYVFLNRMLRHTEDGVDRRLVLTEAFFLGAVCLAGFLLSREAVLNSALRAVVGMKDVAYAVFYPLVMLVLYLIQGFVWLLSHILPDPVLSGPPGGMEMPTEPEPEFMPVPEGGGDSWVSVLIRAAAILIFLLLAWLLLRYLRSGRRKPAETVESGTRILPEPEREGEAFLPPSFLDRSPEAAVRRAYGAYCRRLVSRGLEIDHSDTTRSVNILAELDQDPDAAELRGLYLRARYTERGGLTRSDARRASALARELTRRKP